MSGSRRGAGAWSAGAVLLACCGLWAATAAVPTPETVIKDWPKRSSSEARMLIAKYGRPSRFDVDSLVWYGNGQWSKTILRRRSPRSFLGIHGRDILEQSISYAVPDDKIAALENFDTFVKYDRGTGELSSRATSEKLNYLALNLAAEIVADKWNADEARDFYAKTMRLSESGKSSAYLEGFVFPLGEQSAPKTEGVRGEP
jgi:hypothetical protein